MRILVAGNLANTGYYITKLLRTEGTDAHLLIKKNDLVTHDPKSFDNIIEFPNWIRLWDGTRKNWKMKIIAIMKQYDIIHASTELPIFALFSRKPFIAMTTGDDIIELAQKKSIKGLLLKLAYKKAKAVVYTGTYMYPAVIKLKLKNAVFIPLLWDYEKFNITKNSGANEKFTLFHPTNHDWKDKGNDIFLKAFVRFAKSNPNVHLITINRGKDFKKSLQILSVPELKDKVTILPETLPQNQLPQMYSKVDVVIDQFIAGSLGLVGQEAMACEKPLISFLDEGLYTKIYGKTPPILNAKTEDEIYDSLIQLLLDTDHRLRVGRESRNWLLQYHNPKIIIRKYIYLYKAAIEKIDFRKIEKELNSIS